MHGAWARKPGSQLNLSPKISVNILQMRICKVPVVTLVVIARSVQLFILTEQFPVSLSTVGSHSKLGMKRIFDGESKLLPVFLSDTLRLIRTHLQKRVQE